MEQKNDIKTDYNQYLNSFYDYSKEKTINSAEQKAEQELNAFLEKLKIFDKKHSVIEAKNLFKELYPLQGEFTYLKIGNAKCVIISRQNLFRICIDSEKEYICYSFTD